MQGIPKPSLLSIGVWVVLPFHVTSGFVLVTVLLMVIILLLSLLCYIPNPVARQPTAERNWPIRMQWQQHMWPIRSDQSEHDNCTCDCWEKLTNQNAQSEHINYAEESNQSDIHEWIQRDIYMLSFNENLLCIRTCKHWQTGSIHVECHSLYSHWPCLPASYNLFLFD